MKKILLLLSIIFIINLTSAFEWNNSIVSYYRLDETGGTVIDSFGLNNGVNTRAIPNVPGIINTGYNFIGNSSINIGNDISLSNLGYGGNNFTFSVWFKTLIDNTDGAFIARDGGGANQNQYHFSLTTGGSIRFAVGTTSSLNSIGSGYNDGNWHNAVGVYNGTSYVYIDGAPLGIGTNGTYTYNTDTKIGSRFVTSTDFNGTLDEIGIWNRTLSLDEIVELYNNGTGLPISNIITINSPEDNIIKFRNEEIIFNITAEASPDSELYNMTLYINGTLNETKSLSGINDTEIFSKSFSNLGYYNWSVIVCNNMSSCSTLPTRYITIRDYKINSEVYPNESVESSTELFSINISYPSSEFNIISANFYFNGTEYYGTKNGSGDNLIFYTYASMPQIDVETNYTSYWTLSLTNVNGTSNYNTTSHNTKVSIINFGLCSESLNIPFWNFTILNESNSVEINASFEGSFAVKVYGSSIENNFNFSDTSENNSNFDFCISPSSYTYIIDTNIEISGNESINRFYNFEGITVTNSTREDNLYMLSIGDSTSFIIHTVDVSGSDITDAEVRIQRYYPGDGEWITTEIVTTNYVGEAIGHLLSEDADYRFKVYTNGISIYNSSSTKIACSYSPCTVTLIIPLDLYTGYENIENLISTLIYNPTTNMFTYTYSDTSGLFTSARLYVIRLSPSNTTLIIPCNTTKTSISGVITCDISGQINGTYQASGYIIRTDEFLDRRINGIIGTNIYNSFGNDGILWAIFIFIGIVMIGISRPSLAIILSVVGLIIIGLLEIINLGIISIISIISIAIILLMKVGRE